MAVVTGALPSVIAKLGHLLVGEYNLQKGEEGDIMLLKTMLESMKDALEKRSSKPDLLSIEDKIWASDLRDLSYDIEDSIDTFMVRGKGDKSKLSYDVEDRIDTFRLLHGEDDESLLPYDVEDSIDTFMDTFMLHGEDDESTKLHGLKVESVGLFTKAKIRRGIAAEIRNIKSRVVEVHKRYHKYHVNLLRVDKPTIASMVDPRLFVQHTEAKELVGIDDTRDEVKELVGINETRDELIKILMDANEVPLQQGKIVSIVGFGGLGKTTLAKAVYEKIRALFDCCAFVSVPHTPKLKKLFKTLFYDLSNNIVNSEETGDERWIDVVREFLKTKRYLIVIDDIWDISVWEVIK